MNNIDWLLHEAGSERPLQVSARMKLDDSQWKAEIERIETGPGLRIFLTSAEVRNDITVQPRDTESEPWISSNITVSGKVEIEMPDGQLATSGTDQALLFRPSDRNPRYHVKAPQHLRLAGYALRLDRLERIFDGDLPAALRPMLAREFTVSRFITMPADQRLRRLAAGLFAPGLNGPLRLLFMEGTVLQLLATQLAAKTRQGRPITLRERDAVMAARERLLADMRNPPGLGDLAAAVGLSEKRLNACFRHEFGGTVFDVLRNQRLEHARIALEAGAPLKQVAFRVGYNHVTNFISAFKARYGEPPGRFAGQAAEGLATADFRRLPTKQKG
ncbi:AraC family transcriptional regulator [Ferrovibrio sp. MS7]|uniref:helix-turn-helix transcriptional regulator n=1 Tax=Ferrovibrio plantarum TaxID=3119164 RepID=UPI0031346E7A